MNGQVHKLWTVLYYRDFSDTYNKVFYDEESAKSAFVEERANLQRGYSQHELDDMYDDDYIKDEERDFFIDGNNGLRGVAYYQVDVLGKRENIFEEFLCQQ